MDARAIRSCTAAVLWSGVITMGAFAIGCDLILGIEKLSMQEYGVRGIATGLGGPVAVELHHSEGSDILSVTQDGPFAFGTRLRRGDSYTVALVDSALPCVLRDQTGVVTDTDASIELTCTGASLASLVVSNIAPEIPLMLGTTEYTVELPLLQQSVRLMATVAIPGDKLSIEGMSVPSGESSEPLTLNLGDNVIDIVVENGIGWRRKYQVTLRRATQLAQYAYGKASNSGADDEFGRSVALAGDTLAVGAAYEVGNSSDNGAAESGAVYVFRRTGTSWQQEAYLKASNGDVGDKFGWSVALTGDTLAVGATGEDSAARGPGSDEGDNGATDSGAVYVFRRSESSWQQEAYIKASNADAGDEFGHSLVLAGDTLAVGTWGEDSVATDPADNSAVQSGAVYVFRWSGTSWQQEAYLKASNTGAGDSFGYSVALTGDTLAVGAIYEASAAKGVDGNQGDDNARRSGAVYVFRRSGTSWQQEAYIKASNTGADDEFGRSVALVGDTLAVGALGEDSAAAGLDGNQDDNTATDSGAVYVFRRDGFSWQQEAYVKASNTGASDYFGVRVALVDDMLAVGAVGEASDGTGPGNNSAVLSGSVYVFRRSGTSWQQEAYVKASNPDADDYFGDCVALTSDTLVVGAWGEASTASGIDGDQANNGALDSGAVYIFH